MCLIHFCPPTSAFWRGRRQQCMGKVLWAFLSSFLCQLGCAASNWGDQTSASRAPANRASTARRMCASQTRSAIGSSAWQREGRLLLLCVLTVHGYKVEEEPRDETEGRYMVKC